MESTIQEIRSDECACQASRLPEQAEAASMAMTGLSPLAVLTSFAAGAISFLSPCVLPLVPGYVSYVAGQSLGGAAASADASGRFIALRASCFFVLGFSTVFIALGASATALGQLLLSYRYQANMAAGALVILFGLFLMGLVRLRGLQRDFRFHLNLPGGQPVAAYVIGVAFGFGWTPCIGPILGAILTTSAVSATLPQGMALLAVYSLGLGVPFLAAAIFTEWLLVRLRLLARIGRFLQIGAGGVLVAMGAAIMTGELSAFSYWLLETFPALARIG
jgi:cytochrome c-type biogenesis protein